MGKLMERRDVVDYRYLANIQNPVLLQISYEKFPIKQAKIGVKKQFY
jgi:hypothetical protein